jgi:hypothetical protein
MRLRLAFAPWLAIHPGGSAQSAMRRKGWLSSTERNNILTTGDFLQRIGESDGYRDVELELSDRGLRAIHRYRIEPLSTQSFVEACAANTKTEGVVTVRLSGFGYRCDEDMGCDLIIERRSDSCINKAYQQTITVSEADAQGMIRRPARPVIRCEP